MLSSATVDDPRHLDDATLLAVLVGGADAIALARRLLEHGGGLAGLASAEVAELARLPGLRAASAARVHAALMLGRRAVRRTHGAAGPVSTAAAAASWLVPGLSGLPDEELHALYLDRRLLPLGRRELTRGSDRFTVVDPRQVFRPALALGASCVVIAHNHPSGDPTPSREDVDVTRRVVQGGVLLGVQVLDHLVVGGDRWESLMELGMMSPSEAPPPCWTR